MSQWAVEPLQLPPLAALFTEQIDLECQSKVSIRESKISINININGFNDCLSLITELETYKKRQCWLFCCSLSLEHSAFSSFSPFCLVLLVCSIFSMIVGGVAFLFLLGLLRSYSYVVLCPFFNILFSSSRSSSSQQRQFISIYCYAFTLIRT